MDQMVELDVRDDLRSGREPFSRIMSAIAALADDQVLHLRATFEPVPLFRVMERRGFVHRADAHAPDDWSVYFCRPEQASALPAPPADAAAEAYGAAPSAGELSGGELWLDVRGLEPPQPMVRTLEALAALPRGAVLVQVNVRVPQFLLPILGERGFAYEVEEVDAELVRVRIRHAS
ncbi:MAG TPA: DUF2249 domain-containing protein [Gemmatimonadaceae bacterium]|nr:DUF2249 domain-containing protein [Gemmatimonadaceae bacterium]